jgi:hypothetical protein
VLTAGMKMMKLAQIIKSWVRVLSDNNGEDRITFSDRVYMCVPHGKITLVSLAIDNIQTATISIDDAKEIFRSIKRACDLSQVDEVKTDRLHWKTDARVYSKAPDTVIIQFDGPSGFTRGIVQRETATAAVIKFTRKFGLD